MKTYSFTATFLDTRLCTIEADSLEEAQEKLDSGDWATEDTINFELEEITKPLSEVRQ